MKSLLLCVLLLMTFGLVVIFSASSADVLDHSTHVVGTHTAAVRQIVYACFGLIFGICIYRIGYERLILQSPIILIGLCILLACVFVPGIGMKVNGARRWVKIFGVSVQPSEFVKGVIPLFYVYCYMMHNNAKGLLRHLGLLTIPLGLIALEPNNGTVFVMILTLCVLLFITKVEMRYWLMPVLAVALVGGLFAINMPYVRGRIDIFLHPEKDLKGRGHQPYQAKIASGSGGLLGRGPGNSMQKLSYLPEAQNDYIAAIYAEEYGFVGVIFLICLYLIFTVCGVYIALCSQNTMGSILAAGYTFLIAFQSFLNLAVVCGLFPTTGLNLPFFSQGGSSLVANLGIVGLLLSIPKHKESRIT